MALGQLEQRRWSGLLASAGRPLDTGHRLWHGGGVIGQRMRQHDGVRFGVRQVEAAAQRVAQLVVKRHADAAKHRATQPRSVQALRTRVEVGRIAEYRWNARGERANAFLGHQRHHGVGVTRVQPRRHGQSHSIRS